MRNSNNKTKALIKDCYDILIMGGGLSGMTLAIQLRNNLPDVSIAVIEKNSHPVTEVAHKVGESSVEIGSHYFLYVLGLQHLLDKQLPKLGLRFFYSSNDNSDITQRVELGTSAYPVVPSYQIDRGRFENDLGDECLRLGIDFFDDTRIDNITLENKKHTIDLQQQSQVTSVEAKWLVDASGRNSLLKRKLKLSKATDHDVNAAWFRINKDINIDDWSDDQAWKTRAKVSRHLSTNHLAGCGYWVWIIPLVTGATSIGIVADAKLHPFNEFNTFERAMIWLKDHEPQCASIIETQQHHLQDFKSLKHYAHSCKQMYSVNGWGITGDSGVFIDPFYSPGSDFIAIGNSFLCNMITKDLTGQSISSEIIQYERMFRVIYLAFLPIYQDQYFLMGNAKIMSVKIIWDYCVYWGSIALLFFHNKLCDSDFMKMGINYLEKFYQLNVDMQLFFREWAKTDEDESNLNGLFINYTEMTFLQMLSKSLTIKVDDEALCSQLSSNILLLEGMANEIIKAASDENEALNAKAPTVNKNQTEYLKEMLAVFGSGQHQNTVVE